MNPQKKKTLKLLIIAALLWATAFWIIFALDAEAQGCGKSGHICWYQNYYTCVWRGWRRVCGYVQMCRCVPNSYYYRWR